MKYERCQGLNPSAQHVMRKRKPLRHNGCYKLAKSQKEEKDEE